MTRNTPFLLVAAISAVFLFACCSSTPEGEPALATAGWESAGSEPAELTPLQPAGHSARSADAAELDALRRANENLMGKIAGLVTDVERLEDDRAPAAAEPAAAEIAPEPAPVKAVTTVEGVREILHGEAVDDLPVAMNPRGDVVITLPGSISFSSGKAELKATAQERLRKLVLALRENFPDLKIRAEGHTDSDPIRKSKWASNQELSEVRAGAVEKYLRRLPGNQDMGVSSVGYGSSRPVASNATRAGKAQNRRVELVLLQ